MKENTFFNREFYIKSTRIVLSVILCLLGEFLLSEEKTNLATNLSVMLLSYIIISYDVFIEYFKEMIFEKEIFSEKLLMIIASITAFLLRLFNYNEFFEANLVMILFQVGEIIEDYGTYKADQSIKKAVSFKPKVAHLKKDEKIIDIHPEEIKIGDIIEVYQGEMIPSDGMIISGSAYINMSSLTGENKPVKKEIGDKILASSILEEGDILIKADTDFKDNTISRIMDLIKNSKKEKGKAVTFVDKFAKFYTPIVFLIAVLVAIIPPLVIDLTSFDVWKNYIYISLSILVISCPCAIVISVPLTYFMSISLACKNSLIIKGGVILDKLNEIDTLLSDKTGTLTHASFNIEKENILIDKDEFYHCLTIAEKRSNHPLARSIKSFLKSDDQIEEKDISYYSEIKGKGIKVIYKGKTILVGNRSLLDENNISYNEEKEVGSVIYVARDNVFLGDIVLKDKIRDDTPYLLSELKKRDISLTILTGDKKESALDFASSLKIDDIMYELLPEDKTKIVKKKKEENKKVAFLGDGINDAASLTVADLGIAIGKEGTDLTLDNSDMIIIDNKPSLLIKALKIAKINRIYVLFDIFFSLIVKLTFVLLATLIPSFPLYITVIADTGLTAFLIILSLSIAKLKIKSAYQSLKTEVTS